MPGCPPPLPSLGETSALQPTDTWTRQPDGQWLGPKGRRATLSCEAVSVDAAIAPTALSKRPAMECPATNAFVLTGGTRQQVETVRCVLKWRGGSLTLTFGKSATLELVRSVDDCFSGSDWRAIPPS
jgi:hypothetical protein